MNDVGVFRVDVKKKENAPPEIIAAWGVENNLKDRYHC